jgi:hypothetical protein
MALTNYPNGITSFGIPVLGGGPNIPVTTGKYFFVHHDGAAGNSGETPDDAISTIDAAIGLCVADRGDVIIVMPGHAETIASATSLVVDVAGITIIGLGHGRNRPVLSFSATASRIPVSADDVIIDNLVFLGAVADIVSGITITADYVTLRNCEIASGSATLEFLQFIDIDAAVGVTLEGVRLLASATAGSAAGIRVDAAVGLTIRNCEIRGDFTTTAAIDGNVGTGAASQNIALVDNLIENIDATAGMLIDMHDDTTGIIMGNRGFTGFTTNITGPFDTGACRCVDNLVNNLVDETGGPSPATASA